MCSDNTYIMKRIRRCVDAISQQTGDPCKNVHSSYSITQQEFIFRPLLSLQTNNVKLQATTLLTT